MADLTPSVTRITVLVLFALLTSCSVGLAVTRSFTARYTAFFSPAIGLGVMAAFLMPWSWSVGFGGGQSWSYALLFCAASLLLLFRQPASPWRKSWEELRFFAPVLLLAVLLSADVAASLFFKTQGETFRISSNLTDHTKIAIIDSFRHEGFPLQNPFAQAGGLHGRLSYYYLWYLLAAFLSFACPMASAWEADIALTFLTAFVSLLCMIGLAASLCPSPREARRAAGWVLLLSVTVNVWPVLSIVIHPETLSRVIDPRHGLESWIVQAIWVPQHLLAATLVVLALTLLAGPTGRGGVQAGRAVLAGLLIASAFGMSAWVGGVSFLVCAAFLFLRQILGLRQNFGARERIRAVLAPWSLAALVAALLSSPFLLNQLGAATAHAHTAPIGLHPWPVLTFAPPGSPLNLLAFWAVYLPLQITGVYLVFALFARSSLRDSAAAGPLIALSFGALCATWLLKSQIANNDLGWRALLPGLLCMTAIGASELSKAKNRLSPAFLAALAAVTLAVPGGLAYLKTNVLGDTPPTPYYASSAFWKDMRAETPVDQRVLVNPALYARLEFWPANPVTAILAQRKSCFLSVGYVTAFGGSWTAEQVAAIARRITRLYAGTATAADMTFIAGTLNCDRIAVTPSDGLWTRKTKPLQGYYLLSEGNTWRIYARDPANPPERSLLPKDRS